MVSVLRDVDRGGVTLSRPDAARRRDDPRLLALPLSPVGAPGSVLATLATCAACDATLPFITMRSTTSAVKAGGENTSSVLGRGAARAPPPGSASPVPADTCMPAGDPRSSTPPPDAGPKSDSVTSPAPAPGGLPEAFDTGDVKMSDSSGPRAPAPGVGCVASDGVANGSRGSGVDW